ncbi:MAG: aspartate aminotransferase family protein [Polyangiaceae bacterium]|nr:aspartate aminotransferase family protein [Polyangiaceae bacterium]
MELPAHGWSKEEVYAALEKKRRGDVPWRSGRAFAYVYDGGPEIEEVAKKAYMAFLTENGLDPTAFPSLLTFENDLIAIARTHLHGGPEVVGTFTSGGTESIMLAVKAARDLAKAKRGVTQPKMIVPITAHAAFHKAGRYLGVEVVATAVDPVTFRADVAAMEAAVDERTVLLVGSASGYAHGVVDPIAAIADLAQRRGLYCHVDGCIGGFLLPYFARLGESVPDFDFRVPGVTSISMDLHKYALTPKGASVVLFANDELRRAQYFACSQWTGYTMINPTIQSSKSGGPLAAAWAVMHSVGDDGYLRIAKGLLETKRAILEGIRGIDGLAVMGEPEMCLVAFTSEDVPIFPMADAMKARGWLVQPQLAFGSSRENLHLTIQPSNVKWTETFLQDLREARDEAKKAAEAYEGTRAFAAMFAERLTGPDAMAALPTLIESLGVGTGGAMPDKMAEVNAILNAMPRPIQEELLTRFVSMLFQPTSTARGAR